MTLEYLTLWCIYVSALQVRHQRKHQRLVHSRTWTADVKAVAARLADLGLTL